MSLGSHKQQNDNYDLCAVCYCAILYTNSNQKLFHSWTPHLDPAVISLWHSKSIKPIFPRFSGRPGQCVTDLPFLEIPLPTDWYLTDALLRLRLSQALLIVTLCVWLQCRGWCLVSGCGIFVTTITSLFWDDNPTEQYELAFFYPSMSINWLIPDIF